LKSAAAISSPAPSAAAIASTQTESSGPAIEPSPIPGSEVKAEEGTQLAMAQTTPAPSPAAKASEAFVNATAAEVIVSNPQATGSSAQPGGSPGCASDGWHLCRVGDGERNTSSGARFRNLYCDPGAGACNSRA
jgi:hypothetical protein